MTASPRPVEYLVRAYLSGAEAAALRDFLRRLTLSDFEAKCPPHDKAEAYVMQAAAGKLLAALADRAEVAQ